MKKFKIILKKSAAKELKNINKKDRERIIDALQTLKVNPFSELIKFKKIKAKENLFRIRVGDYRIVYTIEENILTIVVIKIGHRKDIYKNI